MAPAKPVDVAARLTGFRRVRKLVPLAVLLVAGLVTVPIVLTLGTNSQSPYPPGGQTISQNDSPTSKDPSPKKLSDVPPAPKSPDVRAAEWVLESGGKLEVRDVKSGKTTAPTKRSELPSDFRVISIEVANHKAIHDDAIINNLAGLTGLLSLHLEGCQALTDKGLSQLAQLRTLQSLIIKYGNLLTDEGMSSLAKHPGLHEVHISGTGMTAVGVAHLATIPNLDKLGFHGHAITDEWLAAASQAPKLVQLYCGYSIGRNGAKLTSAGFTHLKALKHLYLIDLDSGVISIGALNGLPKMPQLTQLFLRKLTVFDDDLLTVLEQCPNLSAIALHDTKVTDAGMATLVKFPKLKRIYLANTGVTDEGVAVLTKQFMLEHLSLSGTKVTDTGLKLLATQKDLRQLWLTRTKATEAGIQQLKETLPKCEIITDYQEE